MSLCQQNGIDVNNRTTVSPTAPGGAGGGSGGRASSSTIVAVAIVVAVVVAAVVIAMVVRAKIKHPAGALRPEGGKFKRFDSNPNYEHEHADDDAHDIVDATNVEGTAADSETFA